MSPNTQRWIDLCKLAADDYGFEWPVDRVTPVDLELPADRRHEWLPALQQDAEAGDPHAMYLLATTVFLDHDQAHFDEDKGIALVKAAAEAGVVIAQFTMAVHLLDMACDKGEDSPAVKWLRTAAESGDPGAQTELARLHHYGDIVEEDHSAALAWYSHALESNWPDAHFGMGELCEQGRGVEQDSTRALEHYRKAAEKGHPRAMLTLARSLSDEAFGRPDATSAFEWMSRAAATGMPEAIWNLGIFHAGGTGVQQSFKVAAEHFERALEGDEDGYAHNSLSMLYRDGMGVRKDLSKMFELAHAAAIMGHNDAAFTVANCFRQGEGTSINEAEAFYWYHVVATQEDNLIAIQEVAESFAKGHGVARDPKQAFEWYMKGAELDDAWSMKQLAECYRLGLGVAKDLEAADTWRRRYGEAT